jgi:TP901 family phage tail tape measure protein
VVIKTAVKKDEIGILFGVLGGESVNSGSGKNIKDQLEEIVRSLNNDTNSKSRRILLNLNIQDTKKAFTEGLRQITETLSGQKQFSVKLSSIDASSAIADFRKRLEDTLNSLKIDTGFSVTVGTNGASEAIREISEEAQRATVSLAGVEARLKEITSTNRPITKQYAQLKTALGGESAEGENLVQADALKNKYIELQTATESLRNNRKQATQEDIDNVYRLQQEMERLIQATSTYVAKSKEDTSSGVKKAAGAAEEQRATLKQVEALYKSISTYIDKNPRATGVEGFGDLVETRNNLRGIIDESVAAGDGMATITRTEFAGLNGNLVKVRTNLREAGKEGQTFAFSLSSALQKFGQWAVALVSVSSVIRVIKQAVATVVELDEAMTSLQMVTGHTNAQTAESIKLYNQYARELGVGTKAVADSAVEWLRQGKSVSETNELIKTSTMFARVAQMDTVTATELLTAALNGYRLEAQDAIKVVDMFNAVDLVAATSAKELGTAYQYVADSARAAGVSQERLTALLAVGSEQTRLGAEQIGNTWRTLIARMQNIKIGKFIDDETGEALNDVEAVLGKLGIALRASTGAWREAADVVDDVGKRWEAFTHTEQNAIATAMAGTRGTNIFRATMDNYNKVLEYTVVAQESAGVTAEKFGVIVDSVAYKANALKESLTGLWSEVISSDIIKFALDAGAGVVNVLTSITETIGAFPTALGVVTTLLGVLGKSSGIFGQLNGGITIFNKSLEQLTERFGIAKTGGEGFFSVIKSVVSESKIEEYLVRYNNTVGTTTELQHDFIKSIQGSNTNLTKYLASLDGGEATMQGYRDWCKAAGVSLTGMTGKMVGAKVAAIALNAALNIGIGLLISLATKLLMSAWDAIAHGAENAAEKARENADAARENADAAREEVNSLNELIAKYKELRQADYVDAETRLEIVNIQDQIVSLVGSQAKGLDLVNGKLDDELNKLKEISVEEARAARGAAVVELQAAIENGNTVIGSKAGALGLGRYDYRSGYTEDAKNVQKALSAIGWNPQHMTYSGSSIDVQTEGSARERIEQLTEILSALEEASAASDNYDFSESSFYSGLQVQLVEYRKVVDEINAAARDLLDIDVLSISGDFDSSKVNSVELYQEYRNKLIDALSNSPDLSYAFSESLISIDDITNAVDNLMARNFPEYYNRLSGAIVDASANTKALTVFLEDDAEKVKKAYDALGDARTDMDKGNGLSRDTIKKLADASDDYLSYLYEENGIVKLNTEGWQEYADSILGAERAKISQNNVELTQELGELQEVLNLSGITGEAAAQINERIQAINGEIAENQKLLDLYGSIITSIQNEFDKAFGPLATIIDKFKDLGDGYSALKDAAKEFSTYGSLSAETFKTLYDNDLLRFLEETDKGLRINTEALYAEGEAARVAAIQELQAAFASDVLKIATGHADEASDLAKDAIAAVGTAAAESGKEMSSAAGLTTAYAGALVIAAEAARGMVPDAIGGLDYGKINDDLGKVKAAYADLIGEISSITIKRTSPDKSDYSSSDTKEYLAEIEKFYAAEERLKDIQEQMAYIEGRIDASGDTERRIKYLHEIVDLYEREQNALHEINTLRRQQINENVDKLRGAGFDVDWEADANHLVVNNLEHINELQGKNIKATNDLRKSYEDLIETTQKYNDENKKNSESWWDVEKSMLDTRGSIYDQWLSTKKYDTSVLERDNADKTDVVRSWRIILSGIEDEIKYWTDRGYDYASDRIKALTGDLWDAQDSMEGVFKSIVADSNSALDNIQNVYSTLKGAAMEFAESGSITVDTLQSILALGPEYLAFLIDENGQLVIQEENIKAVLAAKTQETAATVALNYVRALGAALADDNLKELNRLLYATDMTAKATWDLVYAELELLKLNGIQYTAARANIDAMRSVADTAILSIGNISGSLADALNDQKSA